MCIRDSRRFRRQIQNQRGNMREQMRRMRPSRASETHCRASLGTAQFQCRTLKAFIVCAAMRAADWAGCNIGRP
eukprot:6041411-Alexandrium_andersonii.AAC.1